MARDQSRLLVVHRATGQLEHRQFRDLSTFLRTGDLLVLNDSKVIPARLRGENARSGGEFELLLLEEKAVNDWWAMVRPGKRARPGTRIVLRDHARQATGVSAEVVEINEDGHRRLRFTGTPDIRTNLDALGEIPLPPYIRRDPYCVVDEDLQRYQTVYARDPGSVAAPTAGLHFTEAILAALRAQGVETTRVTLHVGPGTFAPVKADEVEQHIMHEERYEISAATVQAITDARARGGRVIAVGTTSLRTLESAAQADGTIVAGPGRTRLFVYPPYPFKVANALLTNFHLPRSSLLMLVSAFAAPGKMQGRELVLGAYAEAVRQEYRFFSYGDAMLLI